MDSQSVDSRTHTPVSATITSNNNDDVNKLIDDKLSFFLTSINDKIDQKFQQQIEKEPITDTEDRNSDSDREEPIDLGQPHNQEEPQVKSSSDSECDYDSINNEKIRIYKRAVKRIHNIIPESVEQVSSKRTNYSDTNSMRLYTTSDTKKTLLFNLAPCVKSCFNNNLKLMFDYQGDSVLDTVLHTPGVNALTKPEKFIIPKVVKRKYSNISGDPFKLEDDLPPCPKITKHDKVTPVQKSHFS